jgi:hypothetical protein
MREQVFAAAVGVMKPKPFASLNHLTVPGSILPYSFSIERGCLGGALGELPKGPVRGA